MEERFPNKLRHTVQADHAIAMGAAVAHMHLLNDVVPRDLGVGVLSSTHGTMDMEEDSIIIKILELIEKPSNFDADAFLNKIYMSGHWDLTNRKRSVKIECQFNQFPYPSVMVQVPSLLQKSRDLTSQSYSVDNNQLQFEVDLDSIPFEKLLNEDCHLKVSIRRPRKIFSPAFVYSHYFSLKSLMNRGKLSHCKEGVCTVSLFLNESECIIAM
ncbi:hypothetical protein GEMRC1_010686 [Eukaryota sp. GEM-RC1]